MKTVFNLSIKTFVAAFLVSSLFFPNKGWAFVLPLDFVLKQAVAKTGRVPILINQEVTFKVGQDTFKVEEKWLIEGDKNLKVDAISVSDNNLQDLRVHTLVNNDRKIQVVGKNRIADQLPADFFQRLLFIRSSDSFLQYIQQLKIKEETRLSRADSRVCIAIGEPSVDESKFAQLWIDQEDFLLRKIRMPSGSEIRLSDYVKVTKDFWIPKTQIIKWAGAEAVIKVKSFSIKTKVPFENFYPQNLTEPTEMALPQGPLSQVVEDFYKRFR